MAQSAFSKTFVKCPPPPKKNAPNILKDSATPKLLSYVQMQICVQWPCSLGCFCLLVTKQTVIGFHCLSSVLTLIFTYY